ncbi:tetrameric acyl-CoA thioesterase [Betaproteobacteria bacterium GR16-43]|nr:tetrameric acyl-CoA thioesterase [Betaproteobacteria bacterium GR16-43]
MSQGFLSKMAFGPRGMRWLFNLWPPFRGMGVKVREIAPDFRRVVVELRMKMLNRNYVGTHFGGSMFAMADPFYMVMMMQVLGREYVVWDKSGGIRFLKPGRGTLTAEFNVTQAMVDEVIEKTREGGKFEPTYAVDLKDGEGTVVATVEKTLYIRKKK